MTRARFCTALALAALIGLAWAGTMVAQEGTGDSSKEGNTEAREGDRGRGDRGGDRPRMSPEEMRKRMEEWRKRMSDMQRQRLGATEDEWKVLQPMIEKVRSVQREMRGGMFSRFGGFSRFGRGRGRGSRDANSSESRTRYSC